MAFVDISGFTALSEKLASEGKAGAEQVTEVMNATFGALLDVAYSYGGGLLKFGGDALLLFFDGEGHTARAARSAHEMRRTLRAIGRPRTTAGTVTLKMHVGIHSGEFLFVLAGGDHRELIVTGPAASQPPGSRDRTLDRDVVEQTTRSRVRAGQVHERRRHGVCRPRVDLRQEVTQATC
ncbi:MAG TPA: adenylate/guanylate cyclase domain-containing protein, partial [Gaiellaceae bacterium]|nr:adenylate/guanylate cyclase domain-containing protein [Gaiellaceae bacterium]